VGSSTASIASYRDSFAFWVLGMTNTSEDFLHSNAVHANRSERGQLSGLQLLFSSVLLLLRDAQQMWTGRGCPMSRVKAQVATSLEPVYIGRALLKMFLALALRKLPLARAQRTQQLRECSDTTQHGKSSSAFILGLFCPDDIRHYTYTMKSSRCCVRLWQHRALREHRNRWMHNLPSDCKCRGVARR
jgi:hypothetical protein